MRRTIRRRLVSCPGGCLMSLLGTILLLGLIYWGYCWGWWGRNNLTLQHLFQCQCPTASEAVRYRPFTVLASACRHPNVVDLTPSGRYLIIHEQASPAKMFRMDMLTGQTSPLPWPEPDIVNVTQLDDYRLVAQTRSAERFVLFDYRDGTYMPLPSIRADELEESMLEILLQAAEVQVFTGRIVALAPNYKHHPEQNLVLSIHTRLEIMEQLKAAGVTYQKSLEPYDSGFPKCSNGLHRCRESFNGRFRATRSSIYQGETNNQIVMTRFSLDHNSSSPDTSYYPVGWTADNRAVVYATMFTPHLIDGRGSLSVLSPTAFPVPQPILLVEVPEEYRE